MKVGIFTDDYLPLHGGSEIYAYHLAEFLRSEGHEVSIFTFTPHEGPERGNLVVRREKFSTRPILFAAFLWRILRFARAQDVLHAVDSYKMGFFAAIASVLTGRPLVVSLEGRGILPLPNQGLRHRLYHRTWRWFVLKRARTIIATCREFETIARSIVPNGDIRYIPNPVDAKSFKPRLPDAALAAAYAGKKVILTIRRLVPKNGLQYLIRAMPGILEEFPDARYLAIGMGRIEGRLRELVRELKVEKSVEFLGPMANEALGPYLSVADVVVFPSSAEATSLACTEALASGKAVVASAVGGYPELIDDGKNGLLVPLFDRDGSDYDAPWDLPSDRIAALAKAVRRVLANQSLKATIEREARASIEKRFDWAVLGPKIIDAYGR